MTLAEAIKAELEKYSPGTWVLPDDLDALTEVCDAAVRRLFAGTEWVRMPVLAEYELEFEDYEADCESPA